MRAAAALVVFGWSVAAADDVPPIVVGVGEDSVGDQASGVLSVESSLAGSGDYDTGPNHGYEASARGFGELRAGDVFGVTAGVEGEANAGWRFDDRFVAAHGAYANASLGNRPQLASRRDVARESFATTGIGFRLTPLWHERGDVRTAWLRFGFGGGMFWQDAGTRATITAELGVYLRCRVGAKTATFCVHVLDMEMTGNSGADEVLVTNIDLVRLSGLGTRNVFADVGVRTISNGGSIGICEGEGKDGEACEPTPEESVMTEDLPVISELAPFVGITAIGGPARVELRAERKGFASLDGDMTIEDRASVTGSLAWKRVTFTAAGFAARTRWWTSKLDPGSSAATGGGELGLATRIKRYDVKATAGLARSFYPVLDGSALDSPVVGFRSSVHVSRSL